MLVDSSAWIEFFRSRGLPNVKDRVGAELQRRTAVFSDPIRYETLLGCATPAQRALVDDTFGMIRYEPCVREDWIVAAEAGLRLWRIGRRVGMADLLLAVVGSRENLAILTRDSDFLVIREHAIPSLRVEHLE